MTKESFDHICAALEKVTHKSDGSAMACCPNHDDKNPSLSLKVDGDGRVLFHCFAGCDQNDLADTLHSLVQDADFGPDNTGYKETAHKKHPTPSFEKILKAEPSKVWPYHDRAGNIQWYQCRIDKPGGDKTFRPVSWNGKAWVSKSPPAPRSLFGVHHIFANRSAPILIVEGEKTVDAAREIFPSLIVTTWPNGANAVDSVDLRFLCPPAVSI